MVKEKILPHLSDSCKEGFFFENPLPSTLGSAYLSNQLDLLLLALKETLSLKDRPLRKLIIIPTSDIKEFLIQRLTDLTGCLFGIRFLTLPQLLEHIVKLSKKRDLLFPDHYGLMLHIEYEMRLLLQKNSPEIAILKGYIENSEAKILSLSEELSHVFLHYGTYGGDALKEWSQKSGWQQMLWDKISSIWQFPVDFSKSSSSLEIEMDIHIFHIPHIPKVLRNYLDEIEKETYITYYFKSPTPLYWKDELSHKQIAKLDRSFEQKGISLEERMAFSELTSDTNPLLANLGDLGKETLYWLYEKNKVEFFAPREGKTTLQRIQQEIYELTRPIPSEIDSSIQIHEAPSKLREVEILLFHLQMLVEEEKIPLDEIRIFVLDPDAYFPFIEKVFSQKDSPFGFYISGISALLKNPYFQTIHHFFSLGESRFEAELIYDLFSSPYFSKKQALSGEDLLLLRKIIDSMRILWGFDEEMKRASLKTSSVSPSGSFQFAFDALIEHLPYLDSLIDLKEGEALGRLILLIETIHKEISLLKKEARTLPEWTVFLTQLLYSYFEESEETEFFVREFARLSEYGSFIDARYNYQSIQRILREIFHKGESSYKLIEKPIVSFYPVEGLALPETSVIYLMGLSEDAFPRKATYRSLNELKNLPGCDKQPTSFEKDRYFFLEAILSAKKHLFLSYTGFSEKDRKELAPSLIIQEVLSYLDQNIVQKHPPFSFSKYYTENRYFSITDYALAKAFYHEKEEVSSFSILEKPSEPIIKVDVKDLIRLAKHPVQFYANQVLGVYLDKTEETTSREFLLSYLDKAIWLRNLLKKGKEETLREMGRKNLFPTALFQKVAKEELLEEASSIEKSLEMLNLTGEDFCSITFDSAVKSYTKLNKGKIVAPLIRKKTENGEFLIYGSLEGVTEKGVVTYGSQNTKEIWKAWPQLLLLGEFTKSPSLFSLEDSASLDIPIFEGALSLFLDYYKQASSHISPLMPEGIEPLMKKNYEQFEKAVSKTNFLFRDPYTTSFTPDFSKPWEIYLDFLCKSITA